MKVNVYSVFDVKACCYGNPFTARTRGEAVRIFADVAKDDSTVIGRNPEDFSLYELGTIDTSSGRLDSFDNPVFCARATDFLNSI